VVDLGSRIRHQSTFYRTTEKRETMSEQQSKAAQLLRKHERDLSQQWLSYQLSATTMRADLIKESDLREQSRKFLQLFINVVTARR
jgi:hypothetical protein